MSARVFGVVPLTLMLGLTLLQCGAAAGWWPVAMPRAALLAACCAWAGGCWLLWQIDATRRQPPAVAPPEPRHAAAAMPPPPERRGAPRFAISRQVELDLHERGRRRGELRDISQGGARIAGAGALEADSYGLLLVPGLSLPVPFQVVGGTPSGDLRVRFELTGMALHSFIRQLERLVSADGEPALAASKPATA